MVRADGKIFHSLDTLEKVVRNVKDEGRDVVFTNGCFDILHPGHVDYLEKARALGDFLIVALNTDNSVKKLKGKSRPIQNEDSRLRVMAALASVDALILFDDETPIKVIERLGPDILVKGGDYKVEDIVGYSETIEAGGKVLTIPFLEGHSTTDIEGRIRQLSKA